MTAFSRRLRSLISWMRSVMACFPCFIVAKEQPTAGVYRRPCVCTPIIRVAEPETTRDLHTAVIVNEPTPSPFVLRGDHVTLAHAIKAVGLAGSGGEAKHLVRG